MFKASPTAICMERLSARQRKSSSKTDLHWQIQKIHRRNRDSTKPSRKLPSTVWMKLKKIDNHTHFSSSSTTALLKVQPSKTSGQITILPKETSSLSKSKRERRNRNSMLGPLSSAKKRSWELFEKKFPEG